MTEQDDCNEESMPPYMEIPRDPDDPRFSQSFRPQADDALLAKSFFDTYGFVIFRDVLTNDECREQLDDMMALMQEKSSNDQTIDTNDPATWATALSSFGCPKGANGVFRASLLKLRQHPNVHQAFATVMGTPDLIVNHDRWLLHRPPPSPQHPLTKRNVHLDMNPWEYLDDSSLQQIQHRLSTLNYRARNRSWISENNDVHHSFGPVVQSIVNLMDIPSREHGGTVVIPGFHKTFCHWFQAHLSSTEKTKVGPMQYTLNTKDPLQALVQHPTLRQGSMILWDQRVFHGSTPNLSTQLRAGIPIKAFPASLLKQEKRRAKERKLAIQHEIRQLGFEDQVTPLGRQVFGLNLP